MAHYSDIGRTFSYSKLGNIPVRNNLGRSVSTSKTSELYSIPTWTCKPTLHDVIVHRIAFWAYSETSLLDTHGFLQGHFKKNGIPISGAVVRLYYEPNGFLIASTVTDDEGFFRFEFLEVGKPYYTVIGYLANFNAARIANLTPVHI